jgi:hypothetical protein
MKRMDVIVKEARLLGDYSWHDVHNMNSTLRKEKGGMGLNPVVWEV